MRIMKSPAMRQYHELDEALFAGSSAITHKSLITSYDTRYSKVQLLTATPGAQDVPKVR